jgi:hypothetical protein
VYQQVVITLPELENELIEVLPYYTYCLTEVGCGDKDYLQMQAWQAAVSGGIGSQSTMRGKIDDVQNISAYLFLSGKALLRNAAALSQLLRETLEHARFDESNRIRDLISQLRAQREQSVMGNGHGLAMLAASSGMSPSAALKHRLSGLEGTRYTKALHDGFKDENNVKAFASKLAELHRRILDAPRQYLLIGESDQQQQLVSDLDNYWQSGVSVGAGAFAGEGNVAHQYTGKLLRQGLPGGAHKPPRRAGIDRIVRVFTQWISAPGNPRTRRRLWWRRQLSSGKRHISFLFLSRPQAHGHAQRFRQVHTMAVERNP